MGENKEMIAVPLEKGEWNTIIHALDHKRKDPNNSKHARQQYEDMYKKLTDRIYC